MFSTGFDSYLLIRGSAKVCKFCGSTNHSDYSAELLFHFPGRENLDKPGVLVFPDIVVCFNCGHATFSIPETELRQLADERGEPQRRSS
jgi:hypothetical protein